MKKKSLISATIFMALFISPQTIAAVLPEEFQKPYLLSLFFGYVCCSLYLMKTFKKKRYIRILILTIIFIFLGTINFGVHQSVATFNLLGPFLAFLGYCYFDNERIDLRIFDYFLIFLYFFYYLEYYRELPDLFFRPGFDEDGAVFDMSSSNAIPISLNITLYAYMICDRLSNNEKKGVIFIFALINFVLIIIQQSRAGLVISLAILAIAAFNYSKKWLFISSIVISVLITTIIIMYLETIQTYLEVVGAIDLMALSEDLRGEAQKEFFRNMNTKEFIFGHAKKIYAGEGNQAISYTYNVFLDMWDKYGFLIILIFAGLFLFRVVRRNKFEYPLYYFIPFFMYSIVESIFFPNFWDCILYLVLFRPKISRLPIQIPLNINSRVRVPTTIRNNSEYI
jgi:hypothetical protein